MAASKGYTTSKWAGKTNYECSSPNCDYATLNEDKMKSHVKFHGNTVKASEQSAEEVSTPSPEGGDK